MSKQSFYQKTQRHHECEAYRYWLGTINKSELFGNFKTWCERRGVLWKLMIYDVQMKAVEKLKVR